MRKYKLIVGAAGLVAGLSLQGVVPAMAADLANGHSQACSGNAQWHFVNNQTGGTQVPGTLTAEFSTGQGSAFYTVTSPKVLQSVQHFYVTTAGSATLVDATTNLPGRLVLSDYSCVPGKTKK